MLAPDALAGRVALVTGVTRRHGIGFAIADRLARAGAGLLLHHFGAREPALPEAGSGVEWIEADLAEPDAPARVVARAYERFGRLDVVVANHTHWSAGGIAELTAESLDRHLGVNVRASLLLVAELARRRPPGPGGRVVLLVSGQQLGPMPGEVAYAASKGALAASTATLADGLAAQGITVNAVNPGPTDTGWISDAQRPDLIARSPFGRVGVPDDAARLVTWLVSDDAAWVTGQVLSSDGGFRR